MKEEKKLNNYWSGVTGTYGLLYHFVLFDVTSVEQKKSIQMRKKMHPINLWV